MGRKNIYSDNNIVYDSYGVLGIAKATGTTDVALPREAFHMLLKSMESPFMLKVVRTRFHILLTSMTEFIVCVWTLELL